MNDRARLAFVGLGRWSDQQARAATRSARIEIAGGVSRTPAKLAEFQATFGGHSYGSYEEALADDSIDGVVLTTPHTLHAAHAIQAAEHGKHVLVQKPMALTVADCRRMIEATERAEVVLAVGHNTRRMARYRRAAELIRSGALGEVVLAEANTSNRQSYRLTEAQWRWSRDESPGGPLTSLTVHHADSLNHLVGPVRRISAFTAKLMGPAPPDDVMAAIVEFESGALGYLGGTLVSPEHNTTQLHGTTGVVLVDEADGGVYHRRVEKRSFGTIPMPDLATQRADSLAEELDEFAACVRGEREPEVGGREGMAAVAVIEAIVRSAASGRPVTLTDLP